MLNGLQILISRRVMKRNGRYLSKWNIVSMHLSVLSVFFFKKEKVSKTHTNLPPLDNPAYWELVHGNLDLCNQSLHLDLEYSSQLGKLDLHPILQRPAVKRFINHQNIVREQAYLCLYKYIKISIHICPT